MKKNNRIENFTDELSTNNLSLWETPIPILYGALMSTSISTLILALGLRSNRPPRQHTRMRADACVHTRARARPHLAVVRARERRLRVRLAHRRQREARALEDDERRQHRAVGGRGDDERDRRERRERRQRRLAHAEDPLRLVAEPVPLVDLARGRATAAGCGAREDVMERMWWRGCGGEDVVSRM